MLVGYTDVDLASDIDSRKSTSAYLTTFAGGAVSCQSKFQKCVALSATEAEYIVATEVCKEIIWMRNFLLELGYKEDKYVLRCDSQNAIHLAKNSTFHSHSKHIDVRYHWIQEVLENKLLQLEKVNTDDNWSDTIAKVLPTKKFKKCYEDASVMFPNKVRKGKNS